MLSNPADRQQQWQSVDHLLSRWLEGLRSGQPCVSYRCLMANSLATVLAVESMTIASPLQVSFEALNDAVAQSEAEV